jgi:hypothetical protein
MHTYNTLLVVINIVSTTGKQKNEVGRDDLSRVSVRIRIHFIRIRHFRMNTNPDPDPIRIQGFNDQKLQQNYS